MVNDSADFNRIPIQNTVGNKAQATCFVHNFFIIRRVESSLISKEYPTRQFMAVFAAVKLESDRATKFCIARIANDILSFDQSAEVCKSLTQAVCGWTVIDQSFYNDMCRSSLIFQRHSNPDHCISLLGDQLQIDVLFHQRSKFIGVVIFVRFV